MTQLLDADALWLVWQLLQFLVPDEATLPLAGGFLALAKVGRRWLLPHKGVSDYFYLSDLSVRVEFGAAHGESDPAKFVKLLTDSAAAGSCEIENRHGSQDRVLPNRASFEIPLARIEFHP